MAVSQKAKAIYLFNNNINVRSLVFLFKTAASSCFSIQTDIILSLHSCFCILHNRCNTAIPSHKRYQNAVPATIGTLIADLTENVCKILDPAS